MELYTRLMIQNVFPLNVGTESIITMMLKLVFAHKPNHLRIPLETVLVVYCLNIITRLLNHVILVLLDHTMILQEYHALHAHLKLLSRPAWVAMVATMALYMIKQLNHADAQQIDHIVME